MGAVGRGDGEGGEERGADEENSAAPPRTPERVATRATKPTHRKE